MPGSPEQYEVPVVLPETIPDTFHQCRSLRIIITPCCGYLMTELAFLPQT